MKTEQKAKKYAQELRKNATKEERLLWNAFLRKYDVQFRRQCVFDRYIVDFYCAKARLVVELDGSQHYQEGNLETDQERTEFLEKYGLKVIRIANNEVNRSFQVVCELIDKEVWQSLSQLR